MVNKNEMIFEETIFAGNSDKAIKTAHKSNSDTTTDSVKSVYFYRFYRVDNSQYFL